MFVLSVTYMQLMSMQPCLYTNQICKHFFFENLLTKIPFGMYITEFFVPIHLGFYRQS